jgi:radical SAM/Cys-rich protein
MADAAPGYGAFIPTSLSLPAAGPRATRSLHARGLPLASSALQIATVEAVDLSASPHGGDFSRALSGSGWDALRPGPVEIFQINLGKLCNMTCRHCHVDAGPDRTEETMDRATAEACLRALDRTNAHTVDLTGGAPELNPNFRFLVDEAASRNKHVIDRCNLTILLAPGLRDLPAWLGERSVEVVCSLPHWRKRGTDAQRGDGAFEKSLEALRLLNAAGYGAGDPRRRLTLVSNPVGAFLSASQAAMEREWKEGLRREHGIAFDRLIALNNLPISRYLEWLESSGNLESYLQLLVASFNPETVAGLMCRNTLSIGWDGRVYDCDFNQMLDLAAVPATGGTFHIRDLDVAALHSRSIVTRRHCFGCTAGAGSSCGGALA